MTQLFSVFLALLLSLPQGIGGKAGVGGKAGFGGGPAAGSVIARDGNMASNGTSGTFTATATGDLKIVFATSSGAGGSTITIPAGWTAIASPGTSGAGMTWAIGCNKSSSAGDTTTGTWTNASGGIVGISYSGTAVGTTADCNTTGVGATQESDANSGTLSFGGLTLQNGTGSWVAGFDGTAVSGQCLPASLTQVVLSGFGQEQAADTNATVGSFSTGTCAFVSEIWVTYAVEVKNH